MPALLVFDAVPARGELARLVRDSRDQIVHILPLAFEPRLDAAVRDALEAAGATPIVRLDSGTLVDRQIAALRERVVEWSVRAGDLKVDGRNFRELLQIPGGASAWWFGQIAERNTVKSSAFLRIAQLETVRTLAGDGAYSAVHVCVSDPQLGQALRGLGGRPGLLWRHSKARRHAPLRKRLRSLLDESGAPGALVRGAAAAVGFACRAVRARIALGAPGGRHANGALMFVTYFPFLDEEGAREGRFINRYAGTLQPYLEEAFPGFVWLLIVSPHYGRDYGSALALASSLQKTGTKLAVLESFLSLSAYVRAIANWLRLGLAARTIWRKLDKRLFAGALGPECLPVLGGLWRESFFGATSIMAQLFHYSFKNAFAAFPALRCCLYLLEMQGWETAMNAAKAAVRPEVRSIGFVHTAPSPNHWHYFRDAQETARTGMAADLPLPDVFATNGPGTHASLAGCGYPGLAEVEAVRYLYLNRILAANPQTRRDAPALLVACSVDPGETRSLLLLVNAAFPVAGDCEILLKEHPNLPLAPLLLELGIGTTRTGYRVCEDDLSSALQRATAVLVHSSTVAIEALAYGCEVILPVFPDSMLMNPLADANGYSHRVSDAESLRAVVRAISGGLRKRSLAEYREFVRGYWHLQPDLPRFKSLLGHAMPCASAGVS